MTKKRGITTRKYINRAINYVLDRVDPVIDFFLLPDGIADEVQESITLSREAAEEWLAGTENPEASVLASCTLPRCHVCKLPSPHHMWYCSVGACIPRATWAEMQDRIEELEDELSIAHNSIAELNGDKVDLRERLNLARRISEPFYRDNPALFYALMGSYVKDPVHCCRCGWDGDFTQTVGEVTHNCPECGSTWEVTEGRPSDCGNTNCLGGRCPLTCPHGDGCTLEAGHESHGFGCNHKHCDCNEPNTPTGEA